MLSILLPTAFFAAIDRGVAEVSLDGLISDPMRHEFLKMSRGLAIILLIMYVPACIIFSPPLTHSSFSSAVSPLSIFYQREME